MKNKFVCGICLCLWIIQGAAQAQIRQYYHKDPQSLLEDQSTIILDHVYKTLDRYPPDTLYTNERKLALFSLDGIMHDTRMDTSMTLKNYFKYVLDRVIDSLQSNKTATGIRIFKVYNHGFIIQSESVTIAIDLVGSSRHWYIDDSQIQKLIDLSDVLFVTHRHGDHADAAVADMFAKQEKKVIVPTGLWEEKSSNYIHLRDSSATITKDIVLGNSKQLKIKVFPGHQDNVPNNIYAITTPENLTVMHTGDQANKNDRSWIRELRNEVETDVLLLHCWMPNLEEAINSINPRLIITGHENELQHSIDHREPYWLTFNKMKSITTPYVIMAWGEYYHYK
ncbi:MBL fold metallo-hydrolase [Sphingobacterium chuzhouense]|uniref:MBL fold metallo-hydrolase n=1 Tax=Sphingobacterium chuzhouense TaxID=1742264 RepID=A0ABR7XVL2_9SPHI|nr:MBL fold metallo-hydrolase [Sphingobacterium chuzhouense]MBD1423059.1 MBL fold metallo-hydrolase [Sphingobacterium chuzhouense]